MKLTKQSHVSSITPAASQQGRQTFFQIRRKLHNMYRFLAAALIALAILMSSPQFISDRLIIDG